MYISSQWTARERLRVITILARFIVRRSFKQLPYNEPGTPNAEAIRAIAEDDAATLEAARPSIEAFLHKIETDPNYLGPAEVRGHAGDA